MSAAERVGDEYVPFSLRWPRASAFSPRLWLIVGNGPRTHVELAFDADTHQLSDVTLVLISPEAWVAGTQAPRTAATVDGLPRCDPAAWMARSLTGGLNDPGDYYLRVDAGVRFAVTSAEAVLYVDGIAGEVAMELASGRARIGVDARGAIGYVRLTELTAGEAALLEEHRTQPVTVR